MGNLVNCMDITGMVIQMFILFRISASEFMIQTILINVSYTNILYAKTSSYIQMHKLFMRHVSATCLIRWQIIVGFC